MRFSTFLLLMVLAALLRFYHLGTWSFGYDELFTILETNVFFGDIPVPDEYLGGGTIKPEDTQYYRLPRLLAASHTVHRLGYKLFGEDEFGSRVMTALLGTLSVGVIFLLAQPLMGYSGSVILALLVMLLPEHLLHSQCNRFYIQSFFLVSLVLLLGAHVAQKHSKAAAFWLGPAAIFLVLSNSLGGVIWGGVLVSLLVNAFCAKKSGEPCCSRGVSAIILLLLFWSMILLGIFVFHIIPLAAGWNNAATWGYTPLHAVMALINMLGWPLFLISLLGIVYSLVFFRAGGNVYWFFLTFVSGISVLLLPIKIVYQPFYGFLFIFPFLVTAALFIREVCKLLLTFSGVDSTSSGVLSTSSAVLSTSSAVLSASSAVLSASHYPFRVLLSISWAIAALLVNFPSLYSYYQDGNRPDHRAAFQYVAEHWEDGDLLTGFMMGAAQYYIPDKTPRIPLRTENAAEKLQEILDTEMGGNRRLWIVLHSSRGGLGFPLRQWLSRHALLQKGFTKKRFDYAENNVDVFLVPKLSDSKNKTENKEDSESD